MFFLLISSGRPFRNFTLLTLKDPPPPASVMCTQSYIGHVSSLYRPQFCS